MEVLFIIFGFTKINICFVQLWVEILSLQSIGKEIQRKHCSHLLKMVPQNNPYGLSTGSRYRVESDIKSSGSEELVWN